MAYRLESASRLQAIAAHPESRRVFSFLVVGGTCALFNLAILSALTVLARWQYLPAVLVATEAAVLLSFLLNDRITFRALAYHAGGWPQRCVRYHGGAAAGQVLTILLGLLLIHALDLKPILAQAISLAVVTVFNFAVQRLFTYATRIHAHPPREAGASASARALPDQGMPFSPDVDAAPRVAQPVSMYAWARLRPPADD